MNSWLKYMDDHDLEATHQIIGVDPGGTTGLFNLLVFDNGDVLIGDGQVDTLLRPEMAVKTWLIAGLECGVPAGRMHVAIEKYVITKRTVKLTRQPDAIEVTGAVKSVARDYDAHVWEYTPAKSKKFASDDLLDRVGWMPKGGRKRRHARDAARQVWSCLADVDFATWELCWEQANTVVSGHDLVRASINDALFRAVTGEDDRDER